MIIITLRTPWTVAQRIGSNYLYCLSKHPLRTKALTCGMIHGAGDCVAQHLEQRVPVENHPLDGRPVYNWERTGRLSLIGLQFGPILHYVYQGLARIPTSPGLLGLVQKVFVHQIFFAPISVGWFFVSCRILEGKSMLEVKNTLCTDYVGSMKVNYFLWPAAIFVGLKFIPLHFQVMYSNCVSLFWNTFLSLVVNRGPHGEHSLPRPSYDVRTASF